jgi:hypothetical protein
VRKATARHFAPPFREWHLFVDQCEKPRIDLNFSSSLPFCRQERMEFVLIISLPLLILIVIIAVVLCIVCR